MLPLQRARARARVRLLAWPILSRLLKGLGAREDGSYSLTVLRYRRELKEWDEITERKKEGVEDAKQNFDSERDVDFSQLHSEDVETLKSYLTPEQSSILHQPLLTNPNFNQEAEAQLQAIVSVGCGVYECVFVVCVWLVRACQYVRVCVLVHTRVYNSACVY